MTRITISQIRAIHALRRKAGLSDDDYRDLIERDTGQRSSTGLSKAQAGELIETLRSLGGGLVGSRRPADTLSGKWAPKLRALWIAGWNLGIVRSRDDRALIAFVERQTGITHPRWMLDPVDAGKAIEALKAWLERDGGVRWPGRERDSFGQLVDSVVAAKAEIVVAQIRRLEEVGQAVEWPGALDRDALDAMQAHLGRLIRAFRPHPPIGETKRAECV